jgi:hypothetical protein
MHLPYACRDGEATATPECNYHTYRACVDRARRSRRVLALSSSAATAVQTQANSQAGGHYEETLKGITTQLACSVSPRGKLSSVACANCSHASPCDGRCRVCPKFDCDDSQPRCENKINPEQALIHATYLYYVLIPLNPGATSTRLQSIVRSPVAKLCLHHRLYR